MHRPVQLIIFFFLFLGSFSLTGSAQDRIILDSLLRQVESTSDYSELAQIYYGIAAEYHNIVRDSSLIYNMHYLNTAKKVNDSVMMADAYYWIADFYYYTDLDSSLYYCQKYLEASEIIQDTLLLGYAYELFGFIYYQLGNIKLALKNFQLALEHFLFVDDQYQIGACYNNIGYTVGYGTDQPAGLSYFLQAMVIAESINDSALIADVSFNITYYYDQIQDYTSALKYSQRSLEMSLGQKSSISKAQSYSNLAYINLKLKNFNDAEDHLKESKKYSSGKHDSYLLAELFFSIVECYVEWNNPDSTQHYINKIEKILDQNNYHLLDAYLLQQKGLLCLLKRDYRTCINYLDKCVSKFQELNIKEPLALTYSKMAEAYSALNLYEQAYNSQLLAKTVTDSMKFGEVAGMLSKLEQDRIHNAELEQSRLEMELATQKIENTNIRIKSNLRTAVIAIILLLILFGIGIYFLITIRKKNTALEASNNVNAKQKLILEEHIQKLKLSEDELIELNATKDKFFSIIAHDLKNPFNTMIGLSDLFLKEKGRLSLENITPILESMNKTAIWGSSLLENLLEWSFSQTGTINPKPAKLFIDRTLNKLTSDFNEIASDKNITIELHAESLPQVFADENMVNTVIRNLIHNAVKFSHANSVVKIYSYEKEKFLVTSVEDQGVGISDEELSELFSINKQFNKTGTNNEKGSGLGLVLCKEFVEKNGGEIWVESEEQKGCKFSFALPLYEEKDHTG